MRSIFGLGGALSKGIDGFTYRSGQEKMACLVGEAFDQDLFAVIEAGTGIGKSFAYLVPSMEYAGQSRSKLGDHDKLRTVIATGTLNLMTQLYDKDVSLLQTRLGYTARVSMLCGRSNYLCIRRWKELFDARQTLNPAQKRSLEKVGDEVTQQGASGLRFRLEEKVSDALWSNIRADKDLCPAGSCPYIDECFFYKAKAEAKKADIVVTNHSLLFSDAKVKHDARKDKENGADLVLPAFRHLVIDEAHGIADDAARFYAMSYDPLILEGLLRHLVTGGKGASPLVPQVAGFCDSPQLPRRIFKNINELRELMLTANETLVASLGSKVGGIEGEIPIAKKGDFPEAVWKNLAKVEEGCADLAGDLHKLSKACGGVKQAEDVVAQVDAIATHIQEMASSLHELPGMDGENPDEFIRSVHIRHGQRQDWAVLDMVPFSVAKQLREDLYDQMRSIVFTSATLSTGTSGDFSYWMRQSGLFGYQKHPLAGGAPVSFPSPFDFQRNMLILTVRGDSSMPSWQAGSHQTYDEVVAGTVLSLIKVTKGGVLVLLASYSDLYTLVKALAVARLGAKESYRVKETERTLLFQGQAPRGKLAKTFLEETDSVLLGTHSFWEGVDIPGSALSMVIIPRIPFRNVRDPFMVKVDELARKREAEVMADKTLTDSQKRSILWNESPFSRYQVPYATLMLRQGIGRLIRTSEDRGVVALLDARLERLGYGKTMQKAFPTKARAVAVEEMAQVASRFFGATE
ncbi:MAG: ATP-dependent DNA helicase [Sphaerochaetaceae bacterium]|nr:ATP-dependent DNA helicase [Spirochaetales bacterium]MDY5500752.1 ATP-dependent DNA helicase [Sphaerochaetaceae bacterium]